MGVTRSKSLAMRVLGVLGVLLLISGCASQSPQSFGGAGLIDVDSTDAEPVYSLAAADSLGGAIFTPDVVAPDQAVAAND